MSKLRKGDRVPRRADATFVAWLEVWRTAMGRRSFEKLAMLAAGWVLTTGAHTVTGALVAAGVAGLRHHESFHRLLSRDRWSADELGRILFRQMEKWLGAGVVEVVLDDTLAPKKGPRVFGLGTHLDAVRSTRRFRVFAFGHVWVVLAVRVKLPYARRAWALPVLFRLYRNERECAARGDRYWKKTELARQMLDVFATWTDRPLRAIADLAYCCGTVQHDLPPRIVFVGTMRPDAVLTALPTAEERKQTGRRRKRGRVLPKPEELARDARMPWKRIEATLYGRTRTVDTKEIVAQWYQACGVRLLRIVVVRMTNGHLPWRVFFSTDSDASVREILETYAGRWAIEVTFRDLKQHLGFADSPARLRGAVERTAPFAGLVYSALALWCADLAPAPSNALLPCRPWYRTKDFFSFEDVLRIARTDLLRLPVFDPGYDSENLRNSASRPASRRKQPDRRAA